MYYYATRHEYSIRFTNDQYILYRFDEQHERDSFVDQSQFNEIKNYANPDIKTEAITRKEAERIFPHAFRTIGEPFHTTTDARDWIHESNLVEYWTEENYYLTRGL